MPLGTDEKRPLIVIGGGVGPMAGVALHRRIIELTPTSGSDQDHYPVLHLSFSPYITDRTFYLLKQGAPNPGTAMADLIAEGLAGYAYRFATIRIGVPCNTFHAEPIFSAFQARLAEEECLSERLEIVHMLEATVAELKRLHAPGSRVGLLVTTGTRRAGVWRSFLTDAGFHILEPSTQEQTAVHELIYHREWGLKAVSPPSDRAGSRLTALAVGLAARGAETIILGCTELPLAAPPDWSGPPLLDPVDCLAGALVGT